MHPHEWHSIFMWFSKMQNLNKVIKSTCFRQKTGTFNDFGGDKRDRTADLLNAIQALSQLSYTPIFSLLLTAFIL